MRSSVVFALLIAVTLARKQLGDDRLQINGCIHPENQQWEITPDHRIVRAADGKCVDHDGDWNGATILVRDCKSGTPTQVWDFKPDGTIVGAQSGKLVDRSNYGKTPGTPVWLWESTGAFNQQWEFNQTDKTIRATDSHLCLDAGGALPPVVRPCDTEPAKSLPFCDWALPMGKRIADLVGRLTLEEKISLFVNSAHAVPRLGLPAYEWWNEALHGVAYSPGVHFGEIPYATSFPQVILTAAAFNRTLVSSVARTISTEARAFSNSNCAYLTYWTPNVNVFRDPRWGRGQETPGEDPYLSAEYARLFVMGMQEGPEDPLHMKVSACCKHYTAYDLEDWGGVDRHHFNARVTEQDLADTYNPPFEACVVQGRVSSLMCSYNRINGVPACANGGILTTLARNKWGFRGYITTDCGAVDDVLYNHRFTNSTDNTCKAVLEAGTDIECGDFFLRGSNLLNAYKRGAVSMETLDFAIGNMFDVQFRLGIFDPASKVAWTKLGPNDVNTPQAKQLALEAAQQGIVLLKNLKGALPLSTASISKLAVIGPHARATGAMQGNYFGAAEKLVSPLEGIFKYVTATYAEGCDVKCGSAAGFAEAKKVAAEAQAVVLVVGIDNSIESEGLDRKTITLPGKQAELISTVTQVAKGPVIVIVMSGSSVDLTAIRDDQLVKGILWVGYPGQSGGQAIADVLFGAVNPSGKLPFTVHDASFIAVSMFDMAMRPDNKSNPGRTYRFFTGKPVFPFGAGLSYTNFSYTAPSSSSPKHVALSDVFDAPVEKSLSDIVITVTNIGSRPGADAVLAFLVPPHPGQGGAPLKSLVGFEKVFLKPGESRTLTFPVTGRNLSLVDEHGNCNAAPGTWKLLVGDTESRIVVS